MSAPEDFREMTAATIGKNIKQAFVQQMRLLPKPWEQLPEEKQNDVLDSIDKCITHNINMAVHLIASEGRKVVAGELDQITIKDGVKAVIRFGVNQPLHDVYDAQGKAVLVVVAPGTDEYTGGMSTIKGEPDQRAMDLGHEYKPNSDGEGMDSADDIEDAEYEVLPEYTQGQFEQAYKDGYQAAADGKDRDVCSVMNADLCTQWIKGWQDWQEEQSPASDHVAQSDIDKAYEEGREAGQAGQLESDCPYTDIDLAMHWSNGWNDGNQSANDE